MLIMLPMSIFLVLFSTPIIRVLFERGEFSSYSTSITSRALSFYALGLFCFAGIKILVTSFHALQDTATPAKIAGGCLVLNIFLNLILMGPLKIGGIALASSISATVDFAILFFILNRRLKGFDQEFVIYALKVLLASVLMGAVALSVWRNLPLESEVLKLVVLAVVNPAVFLAGCFVLKIQQAKNLLKWISRKP